MKSISEINDDDIYIPDKPDVGNLWNGYGLRWVCKYRGEKLVAYTEVSSELYESPGFDITKLNDRDELLRVARAMIYERYRDRNVIERLIIRIKRARQNASHKIHRINMRVVDRIGWYREWYFRNED